MCKLSCRDCPYGREDFERRMSWYQEIIAERGILFLFCGRRTNRMKGLLWTGNGFLLFYKRFEDGSLAWLRSLQEAAELTEDQFHMLMMGLNPLRPKIREVHPEKIF